MLTRERRAQSEQPLVIVHVPPSSARAASAGVFITYAAQKVIDQSPAAIQLSYLQT